MDIPIFSVQGIAITAFSNSILNRIFLISACGRLIHHRIGRITFPFLPVFHPTFRRLVARHELAGLRVFPFVNSSCPRRPSQGHQQNQGDTDHQDLLSYGISSSLARRLVRIPLAAAECARLQHRYQTFLNDRVQHIRRRVEERIGDVELQERVIQAVLARMNGDPF
jgi:hypothetical protein